MKLSKECQKCLKYFQVIPSRFDRTRFCSGKCRRLGIEIECKQCSKKFFVIDSRKGRAAHCSVKCRREYAGICNRGNKYSLGKTHSAEWKLNASKRVHSLDEKLRRSVGVKLAYATGKLKPWNKGLTGEKSHSWIPDRTKLQRFNDEAKDRRSSAYNFWRKQVWLRDNYTCKIVNPECKGRIEAHHILAYRDYPELRYEVNNGITLCHAHHPRKRAEEKRLQSEFQALVSVSKITN